MFKTLTNLRDSDDEGFTLIELMVVVLIIAILLAIAIPTFLGAQDKAKDRGAQSSARNSLTAAKTIYADAGTYANVNATTLAAVEPAIAFAATASTDDKHVAVLADTAAAALPKQFYAAVMSKSGVCYFLRDSVEAGSTPGTMYAKGKVATGNCVAAATLPSTTATPAVLLTYTANGWD